MAAAKRATAKATEPAGTDPASVPFAKGGVVPSAPARPVLRAGGHINRQDGRGWVPEGAK